MKTALDRDGSYAGLQAVIDQVLSADGTRGLLILSCDGNDFKPDRLDPILKGIGVPLVGGCFPGILFEDGAYEKGSIVVGLPSKPEVLVVEDMSSSGDRVADAISGSQIGSADSGTVLVIVDGLSPRVNSLLESVFNELGLIFRYLGGGAASLELKPKPSVMTNEGLKQDCAVLAHLPLRSGIGIAHGMQSAGGPYKITDASLNVVRTIDYQPAADFYRSMISQSPDYSDEIKGVLGTDAHFSLGLNRYDAERVILEPIRERDDGSLVFMAEVRSGEFVNVMRVTEEAMIKSAGVALTHALESFGSDERPNTVISFDCISRKMFLGEKFGRELAQICAAGLTHVGALTCGGEIGSNGKDFLDYHNRTCVVGVFGEQH